MGFLPEKLSGVGFECHHGASQPARMRLPGHRGEKRLMAEVYAVEIADDGGAVAFMVGARKAADNLHAGGSVWCLKSPNGGSD